MDQVNRAHTSFFAERVAPLIQELLSNVTVFGLMFVSFQYGIILLNGEHMILNVEFQKRLLLLLLVTAFVTYNSLGYKLFVEGYMRQFVGDQAPGEEDKGRYYSYRAPEGMLPSPRRVLFLFWLDVAQVGLSALLFVGLIVGDPIEILTGNLETLKERLPIDLKNEAFFFLVITFWHLTIWLWYAIWTVGRSYSKLHATLTAVYGITAAALVYMHYWQRGIYQDNPLTKNIIDWAAILIFATGVILVTRLGLMKAIVRIHAQEG